MDCSELLREYSDYVDGLMEPSRARSVEAHLRVCSRCARYHSVMERGVGELHKIPRLEPSTDFVVRLHQRLYEAEEEWRLRDRREASAASAGIVVTLALVLGAAAWIPALRPRTPTLELSPVLAVAPDTQPHPLFRTGPLLSSSQYRPPAAQAVSFAVNPPVVRTAFGGQTTPAPTIRLLGR